MTEYDDYPKEELRVSAERALAEYAELGMVAEVRFKATCPACGARPMFAEPNVIFERMECSECGHDFPFEKGNYMVMVRHGDT